LLTDGNSPFKYVPSANTLPTLLIVARALAKVFISWKESMEENSNSLLSIAKD